MAAPNPQLLELIPTLTADQQVAVEEFIHYLKQQQSPLSPQAAFKEFVRDHADLLERLAR